MKKIICIGSTSKDIFFPTKEGKTENTPEDLTAQKKITFELGAKYHIDNRFESLGGCAANQACGLSRLGVLTDCYTSIGDDSIAEWIKDEFAKEGIKGELINIEPNCLSGLSAIVVDENRGERIIFSNQEANENLSINTEKLTNASFVSVTDLSGDWKNALDKVTQFSGENNIKIVFNPRGINIKDDSQKIAEISGKSEIFFVNKDEASEMLVNLGIKITDEGGDLIKRIKGFGAKVVAITDGTSGAWAADGEKIIYAKATREKTIDTTGAGDAFSSAFMAAYVKGKNLEECLQWGIVNGGNVVNFYGGVRGLLSETELKAKAQNIEVKEI